jgi:hypothetical protein
MLRDHPYFGFTRWFAWYRVPVSHTQTAWLCFVERAVQANDLVAFWSYRLPEKK